MSSWNYIVIGCCLALLGFLLWQEWRRPNRARLLWRCFATLVAVGGLACLGFPVYYRGKKDAKLPAATGAPSVSAPSGVVAVDWRRNLERGDSLVVRGRWVGGTGKFLLMGLGSVLDSAKVKDSGNFSLGVVPAQVGRAVYRLAVVEGKDTVEREDVPVEVRMGGPLRVLLLAAAPDFENSFLMKWLSGGGHAVASRTLVSRGKTQEAFVNREPVGLAALTPGLLAGFDLVIADVAALPTPGSTERAVLQRQMEEKGLGLLVKVDSAGLDSMVRVMKGRVSRVLERDSNGRVVLGSFLNRAGKVIFTARNTSYSRLLAGDRVGYADHWTRLLRTTARRVEAEDEWSFLPDLPREREEVRVRLQTAVEMPQGVVGGAGERDAAVYLAQDAGLPYEWRGRYWSWNAGWHWVSRPGGDTTWWYVWPEEAWKNIKRAQKSVEMRSAGEVPAVGEVAKRERMEFPRAWFWGLFLLGTVLLWVERKMGGMSG